MITNIHILRLLLYLLIHHKKNILHCSAVCVGLPDGDQLAKVQLIVINLSNENSRHRLVKRCAVHIDGGAHREDESGDLPVNIAVFQQTLHGDGQRGRAEKRQKQEVKHERFHRLEQDCP